MITVQPHLKEAALALCAEAEKLTVLLREAASLRPDAADWLTTAATNVSRYLTTLKQGIIAADPGKVLHGAQLLTQMRKYFFDVDLSSTDKEGEITEALTAIHAAALPIINSIDSFDPINLAEAKKVLKG